MEDVQFKVGDKVRYIVPFSGKEIGRGEFLLDIDVATIIDIDYNFRSYKGEPIFTVKTDDDTLWRVDKDHIRSL